MQWKYFSQVFSCLYSFTIGSCQYDFFSKLKVSSSDKRIEQNGEDGGTDEPNIEMNAPMILDEEKQWKMRTQKADSIMKRRIRYHFTDHIRKWADKERSRFPWKLIFHCLLVTLVTAQVSYCFQYSSIAWLTIYSYI